MVDLRTSLREHVEDWRAAAKVWRDTDFIPDRVHVAKAEIYERLANLVEAELNKE